MNPPSIPELLLISDHARFEGEAFFNTVEAALKGGADAVLAREKQMDSARLLAFCARLRRLTRAYDARLLVHTQADVARAVGADGVHLASPDLAEIPVMRRWVDDAGMTISASCHNASELRAAADGGADFALLSPVFPTASHPGAPHLGAACFMELARDCSLPVLALGGINADNRAELTGFPVAVIGGLLGAENAEKTAQRLREGVLPG